MIPIALLSFIKNNWLPILVVVSVLGTVWYVGHLKDTIEKQQKDIVTLTAQRDALQDSNNKLTASIAVTNKAVELMRDLAPNTKKQFDALSAKVGQQSDAVAAKIQRILAEKKPITCEETIDYLINAQKEFKK
jgi:hypothetical protein